MEYFWDRNRMDKNDSGYGQLIVRLESRFDSTPMLAGVFVQDE